CFLRKPIGSMGPGWQRSAAGARGGGGPILSSNAEGETKMNQALKSGAVAFRPRARLLKLIGAELISDDILAITELVKNAHDADASSVTLEFRGVTSEVGEIIVKDDGVGMDLDALLGGWMEPAGSTKNGDGHRFTPRGRRALGEKGVGRFAADKIASRLE